MLEIEGGLLREALAILRHCGDGQRECVCWFTGSLEHPGEISAVLHPQHSASAGHYQVDEAWMHRTWLTLGETGRQVRMQLHSHPGAAYHSGRDDELAAVQTPGFLSLVVPRFAEADDLAGAHLAEVAETGAWRAVNIEERLLIT